MVKEMREMKQRSPRKVRQAFIWDVVKTGLVYF
jgi:hypothetical protein